MGKAEEIYNWNTWCFWVSRTEYALSLYVIVEKLKKGKSAGSICKWGCSSKESQG